MAQDEMKDATFTKGPWIEGSIGLVGANGAVVQVAQLRVGHVSAFENPEAVANGNLMKAAPEMYEALKAARVVVEAEGARATLAIIDAALTKAQGR